jgi:hypothetical protein
VLHLTDHFLDSYFQDKKLFFLFQEVHFYSCELFNIVLVIRRDSEVLGRAISQAVSRRFPPLRPGFELRSYRVGFVVDKMALGQVFSEYVGCPYQLSLHRLFHIIYHPGLVIIGQIVTEVPSGFRLIPPHQIKIKFEGVEEYNMF